MKMALKIFYIVLWTMVACISVLGQEDVKVNNQTTTFHSTPTRTSSYSNSTKTSSHSIPTQSSSHSNATQTSSYSNSTQTSSHSNAAKTSSHLNPIQTSSHSNPTPTSSHSNPSQTSILPNPSSIVRPSPSAVSMYYASSVTSQTVPTNSLTNVVYHSSVAPTTYISASNQSTAVPVNNKTSSTSHVVKPSTPTALNSTISTMLVTSHITKPTTSPPVVHKCPVVDNSLSVPKNSPACIKINGALKFVVKYNTKSGVQRQAEFCLGNGTVSGHCKDQSNTSDILIIWDTHYVLTMKFKFAEDLSWKTTEINLAISTAKNARFPDAKEGEIDAKLVANTTLDLYQADNNHSYSCDVEKDVTLTNGVTIQFDKIQMQPYIHNGVFSDATVCKNDKPKKNNSIVPIAVGCALAGLIIIVLIAYLIGRRKSNRGYQQV